MTSNIRSLLLMAKIPKDMPRGLIGLIIILEYLGRIVGLLLCVAGVVLIVLGYSGSVDWKLADAGFSDSIQTGSLGIVVLVAGVLLVIFCRPKLVVT
jgi:hypothetical protein